LARVESGVVYDIGSAVWKQKGKIHVVNRQEYNGIGLTIRKEILDSLRFGALLEESDLEESDFVDIKQKRKPRQLSRGYSNGVFSCVYW
jgi:hypothetical protein